MKKKPSYTPGPWTVNIPKKVEGRRIYFPSVCIGPCRTYEGNCRGCIIINEAGEQKNGDKDLGEFDCNAHLIATAPDMLEFLKLLEGSRDFRVRMSDKANEMLVALIAKAEGKK